MKPIAAIAAAAIAAAAVIAENAPPASAQSGATASAGFAFKPPKRGAPTRRIGGATRSDAIEVGLSVVAPETLAYAGTPTPVFYFMTDGPAPNATFTLIADGAVDPLVEAPLGPVAGGGVRAVPLAEFGAALEAGVVYEWSIAIVADPDARSEDIVSSSVLSYEPGAPLGDPAALGAAGYWYDLVAALLGPDPGRAAPGDREAFKDLIAQAGLPALVE